jgi:hypothetical protein
VTNAWKGYKYVIQNKSEEEITLQIGLLMSLYTTTCSQITISALSRYYHLCYVGNENLVVEVTEATVSPLTKSASSTVKIFLMSLKMMELHPHVQQESREATGRKIS